MTSKKAIADQGTELMKFFIEVYKGKFNNKAPLINSFRDKYGFRNMIEDLGFDRSKEIVQYFFEGRRVTYKVNDLFYTYDKLNKVYQELLDDEENRRQLRAETKKRVEEWERTHGQS